MTKKAAGPAFKILGIWIGTLSNLVPFSAAHGEFADDNRSINGTGETLPEGATEVGLTSVAYGVTNEWQVRTPSAAMLVGYGEVELRHRSAFDAAQRLSPYLGAETPRHILVGADYGRDFGSGHEQSLTVGAKCTYGRLGQHGSAAVRPRLTFLPSLEYDYYWRGNVSYGGVSDYLPYIGHTWGFKRLYVGVILAPSAGFIPLPYVYWRL